MTQKGVHTTVQNEKVFRCWDYPVFFLLTGLKVSAIFYFFSYWFSLRDWRYYPLCFSIMALIFTVISVNNLGKWFLLLSMRKPGPMTASPGWRTAVITTFAPHAESCEMLEETVKALVVQDYPHDTWVLDEGDDDQVKALCLRLGAKHFSRKNLSQYHTENGTFQSHSKHGNYNAWLYSIGFEHYDIITAFDPDHIPQPEFLSRVLGYFHDPKVGYVQAAQAFYNQKASFIARGAAEETYAYYSCVQMAAYGMRYPIIVGGHNTHRVTALKQVGGLAPHDADDLLITLLYRESGWQGVYVPEIHAKGLTPVDWHGYLTQQQRWARSVLDLKFRHQPKKSKNLALRPRIMSLLHGLNYLHRSLLILIGLGLMLFMLATGNSPKIFSYETIPGLVGLCAVLQMCEFYRQRFYLDWRNEWGIHWRVALLHFAKWPYMLFALYEAIINRQGPYQLTRKVQSKLQHSMLLWPNMLVIALMGSASMISKVSGSIIHPSLYLCAGMIVLGALTLIVTEQLNFPAPYDKSLWKKTRPISTKE